MRLRLPDLLGPELVGRLVKILRELMDDANVGFRGTFPVRDDRCGTVCRSTQKALPHAIAVADVFQFLMREFRW